MSQHRYNVYAFGTRKSRHATARTTREINQTIYAQSMQKAADVVLHELAGYEVEMLEISRLRPQGEVVEISEARKPQSGMIGGEALIGMDMRAQNAHIIPTLTQLSNAQIERQIALYTPTLGTENVASPMIVTDNVPDEVEYTRPPMGLEGCSAQDAYDGDDTDVDSERASQDAAVAEREITGEKAA